MTTSKIGAAGAPSRDYSTLQGWEDACPSNLVTSTDTWEGECYNDDEFTGALTIAGITTSSTYYIELRCAAGESFKDHADAETNPLRYDRAKGVGINTNTYSAHSIDVGTTNVRLTGLQIKQRTSNRACINAGTNGPTVKQCILENHGMYEVANFRSGAMENCLLVSRGTSGSARGVACDYGTGQTFTNCTVVRPTGLSGSPNGFDCAGSTAPVLKNCAIFGFANDVNVDGRFSGSNNASDVAIGFGSANQASKTYANQFEDISDSGAGTYDFRLKSGADCIDNGTSSGAPSADIVGQTRSTTDIGAWEFVSSGGGGSAANNNNLLLLGAGD